MDNWDLPFVPWYDEDRSFPDEEELEETNQEEEDFTEEEYQDY